MIKNKNKRQVNVITFFLFSIHLERPLGNIFIETFLNMLWFSVQCVTLYFLYLNQYDSDKHEKNVGSLVSGVYSSLFSNAPAR